MLKRLLTLMLSLIMISLCFASCGNNSTEEPTEAPSEPEASVTTAVKVVYAAGSSHKKSALKLQDKIMKLKGGASLDNMSFCTVGTDEKTQDDGTFEILLGATNRDLSAQASAQIETYLDFSLLYKDNKLAIYANSDERMSAAVEYVATKLILDGNKVVYSGDEKYVEKYTDYQFPALSISGTQISEFSIIYSASASETEIDFAEHLADYLMSMAGVTVTVSSDSTAETEHEILIGKTNRAESDAVAGETSIQGIPYNTSLQNGKLAIKSDTKVGYEMALTSLKNALESNKGSLDKAFGIRTLSYDEIKQITVGCPNIKEKEDGLYFYKCTDAQMAAYRAQGEGMGNNATSSTGIRLDFVTDSSFFSFNAVSGSKFELYINGVKDSQINSNAFSKVLDTSKGENRITLFFPNHAVAGLSSVLIDEGASCKRQTFDSTFLFIGDSITQGWNTHIDSMSYTHIVSMHYNLDSIVYGVGGGVFDANTLDYYGDDFKPEVITVAYGTNDWARNYSEQRIRDNMKAFLDKLIGYYPDAQIIGISPIWRKDTEKGFSLSFEQAREVIADVYGEYGITCIDGYTLVSHENSKYADDVHPNMEGFMEYGENLIKELDLILAK